MVWWGRKRSVADAAEARDIYCGLEALAVHVRAICPGIWATAESGRHPIDILSLAVLGATDTA
jgi:hypothetical protein